MVSLRSTTGFHEKAVSSCRSDVADRRLAGIRQGVNQASIRTLLSPAGSVQDRVRFAGAPQSIQRAHVVHGSSRRCAVTRTRFVQALCEDPQRRRAAGTSRSSCLLQLSVIMLCPAGEPDCYPGGNTVRARFFGVAPVLPSTVPFKRHRMPLLSLPPLGGTGGGGSVTAPVPQRASRRGRARSSSRSSTG